MNMIIFSSTREEMEDIVEGINTTLEECINEDEVDL